MATDGQHEMTGLLWILTVVTVNILPVRLCYSFTRCSLLLEETG